MLNCENKNVHQMPQWPKFHNGTKNYFLSPFNIPEASSDVITGGPVRSSK